MRACWFSPRARKPPAPPARRAPRPKSASKKSLTSAETAREARCFLPARRGTELVALLPVFAEPVVLRALLRIAQDVVGLSDFLEAGLGVGLLAHVGVVLAREPAVGALDLLRAGGARHAHDLVVVPEFHAASLPRLAVASSRRRLPRRTAARTWSRKGAIQPDGARL
jgi:hypothetical protein